MSNKLLLTLPLVGWIALIFYFSAQSFEQQTIEPWLSQYLTEEKARQLVPDISLTYAGSTIVAKAEPLRFIEFVFRKTAHLFVYAMLAVWAYVALLPYDWSRRWKYGSVLAIVLVVATLDEWIQHFHPGRKGAMEDVVLDGIGGLLGLVLAVMIHNLVIRRR